MSKYKSNEAIVKKFLRDNNKNAGTYVTSNIWYCDIYNPAMGIDITLGDNFEEWTEQHIINVLTEKLL